MFGKKRIRVLESAVRLAKSKADQLETDLLVSRSEEARLRHEVIDYRKAHALEQAKRAEVIEKADEYQAIIHSKNRQINNQYELIERLEAELRRSKLDDDVAGHEPVPEEETKLDAAKIRGETHGGEEAWLAEAAAKLVESETAAKLREEPGPDDITKELKDRNQSLVKQVLTCQDRLGVVKKEYKRDKRELTDEIDELKAKNADLEEKLSYLDQSCDILKDEARDLRDENGGLKQGCDELNTFLSIGKQKAVADSQTIRLLKEKLDKLADDKSVLDRKNRRLQAELTRAKKLAEENEDWLVRLNNIRLKSYEALDKKQGEIDELTAKNEALSSKLALAEAARDGIKDEVEKLREALTMHNEMVG